MYRGQAPLIAKVGLAFGSGQLFYRDYRKGGCSAARRAAIVVSPTPESAEKPMPIILYDLAGAEPDRRFSPFCWRARMALAHKGLEVETVPWRFAEKDAIAFSGQGRVPVLIDGDK